jgi:hypothetical protein
MATLSAPTVQVPLYECATTVAVSGYVPGATVAIYTTPPGGGAAVFHHLHGSWEWLLRSAWRAP